MGRDRLLARLRREISDERVLAAADSIDRSLFVPQERRRRAWSNRPLPIGEGQTISQPALVARMCELLELDGGERVLDVGTGSGYHAALLARLADHVFTVERHASLSRQAARNLAAAGVDNVTLIVGDGSLGHPEAGPYDAINVAATAVGGIPPGLIAQLAPAGRLVAPVDEGDERLTLLRRGDGIERIDLDPVRFVPLVTGD